MIASGATATARFKNEVRQAQLFVEKLPVGSHVFTLGQGQRDRQEQRCGEGSGPGRASR